MIDEVESRTTTSSQQEQQLLPKQGKRVSKMGYFTLALLSLINVVNYIDRYIPSVAKGMIKSDLHLSDFQTGFLGTAFMFTYMFCCPLAGILADKGFSRKMMILYGVLVWCVATASTSLCNSFATMLVPRMLVGIGEGFYGALSPSLLCDFFPKEKRNFANTVFNMAIPVGAAIGYGVGGILSEIIGWRQTFVLTGTFGLICVLIFFMKEPEVGQLDDEKITTKDIGQIEGLAVFFTTIFIAFMLYFFHYLLLNPHFFVILLGYILTTFGVGALGDWTPTIFERCLHLTTSQAGLVSGFIGVVGGFAGTIIGGVIAEKISTKTRLPLTATCGVSITFCGICFIGVISMLALQSRGAIPLMFITMMAMWMYNGPITTIIVNCVDAHIRSRAVAISTFAIHFFGDAAAPSIVGYISDRTSIIIAIGIVPISFLLSGAIWIYAWRFLPSQYRFTPKRQDCAFVCCRGMSCWDKCSSYGLDADDGETEESDDEEERLLSTTIQAQ